jgi:hypothetical protein
MKRVESGGSASGSVWQTLGDNLNWALKFSSQ